MVLPVLYFIPGSQPHHSYENSLDALLMIKNDTTLATLIGQKNFMSFGLVSFIKVIFNEMSKLEQAFLYNGLWFSGYRKKFATHWTSKKIENSHYLVTCAFRVQMVNLLSLCFRIVETFCLYFFYISWLICWLYIYLLTYFVACFQCFILFLSHFTISLDWPLRSL